MVGVSVTQPDVTIVLDNEGVIIDATLSDSISGEFVGSWIGRPWFETVGDVGSDRVRRMIEDARRTGLSAFGQVTQRFPSGRELPMEYATARVAGRSGLVAVGKSVLAVGELQSQLVAAQRAREQEYWKLRESESRYRLLFATSSDAVLVLRAETLRIVELNEAAVHGLDVTPDQDFLAEVSLGDRLVLKAMLGRVREHGAAPGIIVHLGKTRAAWSVRASLLTAEPRSDFLLRLAPVHALSGARGLDADLVSDLIERLPDAFVVLDREGIILQANAAFLNLAQVEVESAVIGERLNRWLCIPGSEATLLANVKRHGFVRLFPTTLQGELGTEVELEIAAVGDFKVSPRHYAVVLRDVTPRIPQRSESRVGTTAVDAKSEWVGGASLTSIVRDTVAAVERRCIADALDRTGGNRSAAAELLRVSRQSLHAKLNRYGFQGAAPQES